MDDESILLDFPISLNDVMTTGTTIQIDNDYQGDGDEEEEEVKHTLRHSQKLSEIMNISNNIPFEELKREMKAVNNDGFVIKKIISTGGGAKVNVHNTIVMEYAGFFENQDTPFDYTSNHKNMTCNMNSSGLMLGLNIAVLSMYPGEVAQYILSYNVMYGKKGIPPRILPEADCMFVIRIVSCVNTPDSGLSRAERAGFQYTQKEAKMLFKEGYQKYQVNDYAATVRLFKKGVNVLLRCRLANEDEEMKQQNLLKKFYYNLAVSYNKLNLPKKACIYCNEYNRLESIYKKGQENVLLQNAIALRLIGDYDMAEDRILKALKHSPTNEKMLKEQEMINNARDEAARFSKLLTKSDVQ